MSRKKAASRADKERFRELVSIGCVVCGMPPEIHHLTGAGMGMRSSNEATIPLCHRHHRTGGYGIAVHDGTKTWEKKFGTQAELLEKTNEIIRLRREESSL